MTIRTSGRSFPLGTRVTPRGVNFSIFSRGSLGMDLLLFDHAEDSHPARILPFDPKLNRTSHYWHQFVPDLQPGQIYAYRAYGPFYPERGLRFDSNKVLYDPYARSIVIPSTYSRAAACLPGDNTASAIKSVVVDSDDYDWEGDLPLEHPVSKTVIYEMHVGGFTRNPNSGVAPELRGTFAGLIEKIPYLKDLGITAVELLPVYAFDAQDAPGNLTNYWGYSPFSFFAPHPGYSSQKDPLGPLNEFRDMVKALHRADIEVIMDVVYNHTCEGDQNGPTLSFRGLANNVYYILGENKASYANFSGCGNTFNANHPIARRMVVDSLRFWVAEMHVDGFRFDLASTLTRDETGQPVHNPPIVWDIESDPILAGTKLIAEAWDAAGLYQVGSFVGERWMEWNGQFRDDVRAFVRGDRGIVTRLPDRVLASPDLYAKDNRGPDQSVNFITCHDGFTLNDLTSYNEKHNLANLEENRDGTHYNLSWNCGVEGPSDDPEIEALRHRQVKNYLAFVLLSMGTPMLLMGDEVRRTQLGNNNGYCQDNKISWFDWSQVEPHAELRRFIKLLITFRQRYITNRYERGLSLSEALQDTHITWHGTKLNQPDWGPDSHCLALTVTTSSGKHQTHFILNAFWDELVFELPELPPGCVWRRLLDTHLSSPDDIFTRLDAPAISGGTYRAAGRSMIALVSDL